MDFGLDERTRELSAQLQSFMDSHIYPAEKVYAKLLGWSHLPASIAAVAQAGLAGAERRLELLGVWGLIRQLSDDDHLGDRIDDRPADARLVDDQRDMARQRGSGNDPSNSVDDFRVRCPEREPLQVAEGIAGAISSGLHWSFDNRHCGVVGGLTKIKADEVGVHRFSPRRRAV